MDAKKLMRIIDDYKAKKISRSETSLRLVLEGCNAEAAIKLINRAEQEMAATKLK